MIIMRQLLSALSLVAVGLAFGGCSPDDTEASGSQDIFGIGEPTMQEAPMKPTMIDGFGAFAANKDFVFAKKTTGFNDTADHQLVRIRHGEKVPEVLGTVKGSWQTAIVVDDALFVMVFSSGWQVLKITKGAAPVRLEAPQFPSAFARKGADLLVAGQKDTKGPEGGVLAFPLAGGAARVLIPQSAIDKIGGVGSRSVTFAGVRAMEVVGNDLVLGIQRTVNGGPSSGIVIAKAPVTGGQLEVLWDSHDADIFKEMAVLGSDVWFTRSIAGGVIGSSTAEIVRVGIESGSSKRIRKPADEIVSAGDRVFVNQEGDIASINEPSTMFRHVRVPDTAKLVASPDGKRIYAGGQNQTARLDR